MENARVPYPAVMMRSSRSRMCSSALRWVPVSSMSHTSRRSTDSHSSVGVLSVTVRRTWRRPSGNDEDTEKVRSPAGVFAVKSRSTTDMDSRARVRSAARCVASSQLRSQQGVGFMPSVTITTLIKPSTDCPAMPEYTNLSDVIVDGRIESSAQGGVMGSFAVMPTASALNENCIVLYTGTTGTYVSGRFYMCVESGGSYSWQPVTISGTEAPVFTASRALVSDSLGAASASSVTATELAYLSGLTGNLVTLLGSKVDKVSGMGLSQNSYTTGEKNKLAGIAAGAEVNVISAVQNNGVPVEVVGKTVNITHPTLLSQFTNDTQFITSTVANLQNYYDKATVNDMISAIPKFAVQVSQSGLPASGNSTTIYLVPKTAGSQDAYDEYLWVNSAWEKIGSTAVQFSFDQSGTDILINGTAIRSASSSQSGVMTTAQVSELTTATSNISNLQSQYSSLNGTVSSLSSRLDTAESTLSTTASRVATCEGVARWRISPICPTSSWTGSSRHPAS